MVSTIQFFKPSNQQWLDPQQKSTIIKRICQAQVEKQTHVIQSPMRRNWRLWCIATNKTEMCRNCRMHKVKISQRCCCHQAASADKRCLSSKVEKYTVAFFGSKAERNKAITTAFCIYKVTTPPYIEVDKWIYCRSIWLIKQNSETPVHLTNHAKHQALHRISHENNGNFLWVTIVLIIKIKMAEVERSSQWYSTVQKQRGWKCEQQASQYLSQSKQIFSWTPQCSNQHWKAPL